MKLVEVVSTDTDEQVTSTMVDFVKRPASSVTCGDFRVYSKSTFSAIHCTRVAL